MAKQDREGNILNNLFSNESFFNSDKSNLLRYLFVLILVGVFLMLIGNFFDSKQRNRSNSSPQQNHKQQSELNSSVEERLESRLEEVLSQVAGVGSVSVNITLETGPKYIYARDDEDSTKKIMENDKSGGARETEQQQKRSQIVVLNQGGTSKAVIKKKVQPQIRGVLVVAEGASNSRIKANLIAAVKVGLGVESYKIKVLAKER
ncbi:stage III sporulation protein AG [Halanaerobacter jeridensis]|nr:stage III sporulation protein AG [Halanaerobacter jeridensis]